MIFSIEKLPDELLNVIFTIKLNITNSSFTLVNIFTPCIAEALCSTAPLLH